MASAPYQYVDGTGVVIPDTSDILTEIQTEYQATFGTDLIVTPDTPQGVLIVAEALARTEVVNNNAAIANQINPNAASGVFLDAIMALSGQSRIAATRTLVPGVTLSGVAGVTIPVGTVAKTPNGDLFSSLSTVVLNGSGHATVDFASVQYGPVACAINALNLVVTNILGWESVLNPNAAILGVTTQSDASARAYRNNTLSFQGVALPDAITSALYAVSGVTSLTFLENVAATTQTIQGISMVGHSVYACVRGGSDLDVAAALLENKSSGAAWNGSTTINIVEPASGQTYAVTFDRPTEIPVLVRVTTSNGNAANIQQAVKDYVAGSIPGLSGLIIGADVSPFEISGAIMNEYPGYFISKVEVTLASAPTSWSTNTIVVNVNQIATVADGAVTVVVSS